MSDDTDSNPEIAGGRRWRLFRWQISSLRWRILVWHSVILTAVTVAFAVVIYLHQRRTTLDAIDSELTAGVTVLTGKLQAADPDVVSALLDDNSATNQTDALRQRVEALASNLQVPQTFAGRRYRRQSEEPYCAIWRADGSLLMESDPDPQQTTVSSTSLQLMERHLIRNRGFYREAIGSGPQGTIVVVGRFIEADLRDLRDLPFILAGIGCAVLVLGVAGGWFLSRNSVRPIQQISDVASSISQHDLAGRIEVAEMDLEFQQLSETLNNTFQRLESAFAQQVKFTADASHELRTPLSVIKMHQELALSRDRSAEEYRQAIEVCQRSTLRMTSLTEALLELAKLDTLQNSELPLAQDVIHLKTIAMEVTQDVQPISSAQQVSISTNVQNAEVVGDAAGIAQVVFNLLTNAIAYSSAGSQVKVSVEQGDSTATICVSDSGTGIVKDEQSRIFDRFYRAEDARSRDTGGSGLGLAICKSIVEAHGGSIRVESELGVGSQFYVTLPK